MIDYDTNCIKKKLYTDNKPKIKKSESKKKKSENEKLLIWLKGLKSDK